MDKKKKVLLIPVSVYHRFIDDFMMVYSFLRYIIHIIQRGMNDPSDVRKLLALCDQFNPQAEAIYYRWNILPDKEYDVRRFLTMQEDGAPGDVENPIEVLPESVESLSAQLLETRASVEGFANYLNRIMSGIDELLDMLDEQDWPVSGRSKEVRQ